MKHVYVVQGTTGEYSDRSEWFICAFTTEQAARDLVTALSDELREILNKIVLYNNDNPDDPKYEWNINSRRCPEWMRSKLDPDLSVDYSGARYQYDEIELRGEDK